MNESNKSALKIKELYSKGYAGVTMGGTSFMFQLEVEDGRFPYIEEKEPNSILLNVLIKEKDKMSFRLVTGIYSETKKKMRMWAEDETFTKEEIEYFEKYVKENKIIEEATNIKNKVKNNYEKLDKLYEDLKILKQEQEQIRKKHGIKEEKFDAEELILILQGMLDKKEEEKENKTNENEEYVKEMKENGQRKQRIYEKIKETEKQIDSLCGKEV